MKKILFVLCLFFSGYIIYGQSLNEEEMRQKTRIIINYVIAFIKNGKTEMSLTPVTSSDIKGMVSPDNLVWGLMDFLLNRAKDEIAQSFLKDFLTWFEDKKYEHYQYVFPDTYRVLQTIAELSYRNVIPAVKAAIFNDFQNLPANLGKNEFIAGLKIDEKQKTILKELLAIIVGLKSGEDPAGVIFESMIEIVKAVDEKMYGNPKIKIMLIITCGYVIAPEKMDTIIKNFDTELQIGDVKTTIFKLFISEINEQFGDFTITDADLGKMKMIIKLFSESFGTMKNLLAQIKKESSAANETSAKKVLLYYIEYVRTVFIIIEDYIGFMYPEKKEEEKQMLEIAEFGLNLSRDLLEQNYSLLIVHFLHIIDVLNGDNKIPVEIVKFMTFAANLAAARSADEVSNVLEAASAPVGSYRVKRENPFTFTINSYLGFTGGYAIGLNAGSVGYFYIGPTLPLGIELTIFAFGKDTASLGLFLSAIDLGNLVQVALSEETSTLPRIDYKNLLAPGIAIVFGFSKHPITMALMLQYIPENREATGTGAIINELRLSFFLACDLVIFRF